MMAHRHQCPHLQHAPDYGPAAPHGPLATPRPAIPMARGPTHQGGTLLAAQQPQLRQLSQPCAGAHGPYPRRTLPEVVMRPPERTRADGPADVGIEIGHTRLQLVIQSSISMYDERLTWSEGVGVLCYIQRGDYQAYRLW